MSKVQRGGLTLKTGKIGRVNCLRQQMLMPGERVNISINGNCRLESLRERDAMRINAHLAVFMQPVRWLFPDWPNYIKEGPNTAITIPEIGVNGDLAKLGIGAAQDPVIFTDHYAWWWHAYLNCYNKWYKWPEDADSAAIDTDGEKAVPLSKTWSRCRYTAEPGDASDYEASSATVVDVRDIAETQAKFRSAMKRDVLSYNRWMELVQDTYKGDGSREVDQVPIMLDQTEVGVNPREIPATDGASLGVWQSLFDFNINHQIRGVTAPEHMILTYMLVVRFAAVGETKHPLTDNQSWQTITADPEFLCAARPEPVLRNDVEPTLSSTQLGYLPAGWQWRADSDVVGPRVDNRNSFPYMEMPTTQEEAKDATRIKDAFRSSSLGDYLVDIFVSEDSTQPIGTSMDSYMSGMMDHTKGMRDKNDEFPHGGKML